MAGAGISMWYAEQAWLPPGRVARGVLLVGDDRFVDVAEGLAVPPPAAHRLPGLVLPGFANAHSHAFHRALRGRTHSGAGSFWSWRSLMYAVAELLTPDSYLTLARAVYAEMALAGITAVGEFHYLHHDACGRRYASPNVMADALRQAAADAGLRLTLLDTCYLHGGPGPAPLEGVQLRFGDGDVEAWAARVAELRAAPGFTVGTAIHSVRAVSPREAARAAAFARELRAPLHAHVSEQPAENDACRASYGRTPVEVLDEALALGSRFTAVHATHLEPSDVARLAGSSVCLCPTTERDLADGVGPGRALLDAGAALCLGTDSHAVIDMLEELRAVETDERLATLQRGRFATTEQVTAATVAGHRSIGWPDAGELRPGAHADLVSVRLDSVRTAGVPPEEIVWAATAADVDTVVVDGRVVVAGGRHARLDDVPGALATAIQAVT